MCEYFPEEIIVQILSRLPAKSVLKFSCVCKLWDSIIKNPNFISTFSSNKHDPYVFTFHSDSYKYRYSIRFDDKDFNEYVPLRPLRNQPDSACLMIGTSNGLVCLCFMSENGYPWRNNRIDKLIIWNPCIRKCMVIPEPDAHLFGSSCEKLFGFGFDSRTNDYKLFLGQLGDGSIHDAVLYSLNSNSWKKITTTRFGSKYHRDHHAGRLDPISSAFVDGRFYWPMTYVVAVFDLRDEMFQEMSLPKCGLRIKAFGESTVAVFCWSDIWVMKEYITGEWMNLATLSNGWRRASADGVGFRDNGEVLAWFVEGRCIPPHDINNRRRWALMDIGSLNDTIACYRYVESLALLDKGDDVSNLPFLATT